MVAQVLPTRRRREVNWWLTALMLVCSLTVLIPLYFAIVTALKRPEELTGSGFGLPSDPRWANFADAWRFVEFVAGFRNQTRLTIGEVTFDIESCRVIRDGS